MQFEYALKKLSLFYSRHDLQCLSNYYSNEAKQIDLMKFLHTFHVPLNDRKQSAIRQIFEKLDTNGNGVIEMDDLGSSLVLESMINFVSGVKTKEESVCDWFEVFDTNQDGKVTIEEFLNYYTMVSY